MALQPGQRLGPYEIVTPIGKGGMGEVYRAIDTRLGRSVAIKVSLREFDDRFEREAQAISSLNHPHIRTLHDIGSTPEVPGYLVMEFVDGETLADLLARGPLPLEKALTYAGQITDALAAAHAKGIIHRDLKPGNIIVTPSGVKVLDFGLAKLRHLDVAPDDDATRAATAAPLTGRGVVIGTPQYMSPEQVQARGADERSDIFAFGAVLYEMLTGHRAFSGDNGAAVMASVIKDQPLRSATCAPTRPVRSTDWSIGAWRRTPTTAGRPPAT